MDENTTAWVFWVTVFYLLFSSLYGTYFTEMKGRSVGEGFLSGFFFGPLGLVIGACMPTLDARGKGHL